MLLQAACVFLIQRGDCTSFAPCHAKDPKYAQAVVRASALGVVLTALLCKLSPDSGEIQYLHPVPVDLSFGAHAP